LGTHFIDNPNLQAAKPVASGGVDWRNGGSAVESRDSGLSPIDQRLEVGGDGSSGAQAVQSSDSLAVDLPVGRAAALSVSSVHSEPAASQDSYVPDTTNNSFSNHAHKVLSTTACTLCLASPSTPSCRGIFQLG